MRKKTNSKFQPRLKFIPIRILCSLVFSILLIFSLSTITQGAQLSIHTTNENDEQINEIYEGETFKVSTYDPDITTESPFLSDVSITFNELTYQIQSDSDTAIIIAPSVTKNTDYKITASKTGYANAEETITVLKKSQLTITPEKYTVNENELFQITITDADGRPVSEATVAIQNYGSSQTTDSNGMVWLTAPEGREKITLIATKENYEQETLLIGVNIPPPPIENPYIPIFVAIVLLIVAIIFVNLRQRKNIDNRAREITQKKVVDRYNSHGAIVTSDTNKEETTDEEKTSKSGPKVEEIRISRPRKDKEIYSVNDENKKEEEERKIMPVQSNSKEDSDWFEGDSDLKYEIDRLTGEIDEDGLDKWFEGTDNIKDKIDEKVKKKDKKKTDEDD